MKFKLPQFKLPKLSELTNPADREKFLYKVLPHYFLEIMNRYFRVQVEGVEFLPKSGAGLIAPNHSGVTGFDAMVLAHEIGQASRRKARVLTHYFWFLSPTTAIPANKLGFIEATFANGVKNLLEGHLVIIFPEGEVGNFKPTAKAYQLQEFKRGFVRMALETGAPIIPTLILGAEETHINLSQFKLTKFLRGLVLPLPLNIIPLPSKWKIIFLPPIHLPYKKSAVHDSELVREIAFDIQEQMQQRLRQELALRSAK